MNLTSDNYFSQEAAEQYMSVSQYKAFEKCEAMALAEIQGIYERKKTSALMIGSYVDAYYEGTLEKFKKENPECFKRDGTLKSEFVQAEEVIKAIDRQPYLLTLLSGKKQKILTGTIEGVDVKIKIDSLLPNMIVDLKVMRDFAPIYIEEDGRLPWYQAWGYDIQGAIYREIVRQNTGKTLPFVLVAATKEEVPDVDAIEIDTALLDYELSEFKIKAPRYDAIKKGIIDPIGCGKCNFCKSRKIITEIRKTEEEI